MTAAREGRFWEFVDYVLDHQDSLREQDLMPAGRLGLDEEQVRRNPHQHRYAATCDADLEAGFREGSGGAR